MNFWKLPFIWLFLEHAGGKIALYATHMYQTEGLDPVLYLFAWCLPGLVAVEVRSHRK